MIRWFPVALVVMVFMFPCHLPARDIKQPVPGTVRIDAKYESGTGFVVHLKKGEDYHTAFVVTASHVVKGDPEPKVTFPSPLITQITTTKLSQEADGKSELAVLEVTFKRNSALYLKALPIAPPSLRLQGGEELKIYGYPMEIAGPSAATATAKLKDKNEERPMRSEPVAISKRQGRSLYFAGHIQDGYSGSPILKKGKVVGMVQEKDPSGGCNRANTADSIKDFLNGNPRLTYTEGSLLTVGGGLSITHLDKKIRKGALIGIEAIYEANWGPLSGIAPNIELGTVRWENKKKYPTLPGLQESGFSEDNDLFFAGAGLKAYFKLLDYFLYTTNIQAFLGGTAGYSRESESPGIESWYYNLVTGIGFYTWKIRTSLEARYCSYEISEKEFQFHMLGNAAIDRKDNRQAGASFVLMISLPVW